MTSPRHRLLVTAAATVLFALTATAAQAAAKGQCAAVVEKHLQSQGLGAEAIARTSYVTDIANLEIGSIREYQAWTPLASCSGSLVTKLNTSCKVKETYASGDCSLKNVRAN